MDHCGVVWLDRFYLLYPILSTYVQHCLICKSVMLQMSIIIISYVHFGNLFKLRVAQSCLAMFLQCQKQCSGLDSS